MIQIETNLEGPQRDNFGWIWDLFFEDKVWHDTVIVVYYAFW